MSSLREKKKKEFRKKIIIAALKIFKDRGYNDTTMSAIAKKAEVGVGTIYNYFKSKAELFVSIFVNNDILQNNINDDISKPKDNVVDSIMQVISAYKSIIKIFSKKFWREIMTAVMESIDESEDIRDEFLKGDFIFIEQVTDKIRFHKEEGNISQNIDEKVISEVIYSICMSKFMFYFMYEEMEYEEMERQIRVQVESLFRVER